MLAGLGRGRFVQSPTWSQSETGIIDFYSFVSINDDLHFIDCLLCVQPPANFFTNVTLLNPCLPCCQALFYRGPQSSRATLAMSGTCCMGLLCRASWESCPGKSTPSLFSRLFSSQLDFFCCSTWIYSIEVSQLIELQRKLNTL